MYMYMYRGILSMFILSCDTHAVFIVGTLLGHMHLACMCTYMYMYLYVPTVLTSADRLSA